MGRLNATRAAAGHHVADLLSVAFRAFVQQVPPRTRSAQGPPALGWPKHVLVLDTETTTDPVQRLLFGSWRFGEWGPDDELVCLEEGLFYADELADTDPDAWACLQDYQCSRPAHTEDPRCAHLLLESRREFVNTRLWKSLEAGALIVGYNLPFDLTRLAIGAGAARGRRGRDRKFVGGFSVPLFDWRDGAGGWRENQHRSRFRFRCLDSRRALMGLWVPTPVQSSQRRVKWTMARLLDLKALVFALTDKHLSLDKAAQRFGVVDHKLAVERHGRITSEYIDYNRQDVALTVAVLEAARDEWDQHPLALSPDRVMSPAGLAKGYLRAFGVTPPAVKFAAFPPELLGAAMSAYYGGRSEVRVRRTAVPVVYLDFLSEYPTVNALLGTWQLLIAERLKVADVAREVQRLGDTLTVERCLMPEFWRQLCFLAKVRPAGDIVPVRAQYDAASPGNSIGVNPLWCEESIWLAGPDLVASWLLTGQWPEVLQAVRLVPEGQQRGLRPVQLRGRIPIDPSTDDFFRRVPEVRHQIKRDLALPKEERERLERLLKTLGNSGAYGIYAELNVQPPDNPDGDAVMIHGGDERFISRTTAPEEPGEYWFSPFAAFTTAGARLMLALLERLVSDAGGVVAFGDTDSAAIVALPKGDLVPCPGGPHRLPDETEAVYALSWEEVERIRQQFAALNPYDPAVVSGSILELEDVNFAENGAQRRINAFAISAKRYALFTVDADGNIKIVEAKEHGLGHLLNPKDLHRDDRGWTVEVWEALVHEGLGQRLVWPDWVDQPAVSRVSISNAELLKTFDAINVGKPYQAQIKPTNFGLSVSVLGAGHPIEINPGRFHLLAEFEKNPSRWLEMTWYDKYSGQPFKIGLGRDAPADRILVKSYRDVLHEYRDHPEPKSMGANSHPCDRGTVGLLARRPVQVGARTYVGKESNRLEDVSHGLVHDVREVQATYSDVRQDPWRQVVVPFLRRLPRKDLARRARRTPRTVQASRNGRTPSYATRKALLRVAFARARVIVRSAKADPELRRLADRLLRLTPAASGLTGGEPRAARKEQ